MMLLLATVLGIGATACGSDKDNQDKSGIVMDESKMKAATDMRDFFFPEGEGKYNYDVYNLMLEDDESVKVKVEKK